MIPNTAIAPWTELAAWSDSSGMNRTPGAFDQVPQLRFSVQLGWIA